MPLPVAARASTVPTRTAPGRFSHQTVVAASAKSKRPMATGQNRDVDSGSWLRSMRKSSSVGFGALIDNGHDKEALFPSGVNYVVPMVGEAAHLRTTSARISLSAASAEKQHPPASPQTILAIERCGGQERPRTQPLAGGLNPAGSPGSLSKTIPSPQLCRTGCRKIVLSRPGATRRGSDK